MVTEASIQKHVNFGLGKAASKLGHRFVQYRPKDAGPVLVNPNIVQELYLAFDQSPNFDFIQTADYNKSKYYALLNLTHVQIGDYLWDWGASGATTPASKAFFIANIEPLKAAELILCNRTISLYRPSGQIGGYGGNVAPVLKFSGWPVMLIPGTKGEANEARTPGSIRAPWGIMALPNVPGIVVDEYDLVIDDLDRRFVTSTVSYAKEGIFATMALEQA